MTLQPLVKKSLLLICSLTLVGCSSFKLTYNNLDWVVPWYLDDYLEMTDAQEEQFDQEFPALWEWHRREELPKYADILRRIEQDIANQSFTREGLEAYAAEAEQFYKTTMSKAIRDGATLMQSLTDEQLEELKTGLDEDTEEFVEYVEDNPPEERAETREKRLNKTFRRWLGSITKRQKDMLTTWSQEVESTLEYRLEYVKDSRAAFFKVMEQRSDQEKMVERLTYLATERDTIRNPEFQAAFERNRERFYDLLLKMQDTLTDKQIRRLKNRVSGYAEDFEELSRDND